MPYDVSSPRYAHLKGLTQNEISLVMTIADTAISQAKKEFEQNESSISPKDCNISLAPHSSHAARRADHSAFRHVDTDQAGGRLRKSDFPSERFLQEIFYMMI